MSKKKIHTHFWIILTAYITLIHTAVHAQKIQAQYSPAGFAGPFSGKVILSLSKELHAPKHTSFLFSPKPDIG